MKPFRVSLDVLVAAEDLGAASAKLVELEGAAAGLGFHPSGSAAGVMDPEDVVEGSPLARELEGAPA